MNQCVLKVCLVGILCCVRVPGQNAEPDCSNMPRGLGKTETTVEFQAWLESLSRKPCAGQTQAVLPGAVSARSLAHKPLPKARQEFDRGMRARRKGLAAEAVEHFASAARLDPDFVDAYAYAGLVQVEAGQPSGALTYYQQAVQLEPGNAALLSNLAIVLLALHRPEDAESAGRRAVQLAPSSPEPHYMVGLALSAQGKWTRETVTHLTIAAEKYPRARQLLEAIRLSQTQP